MHLNEQINEERLPWKEGRAVGEEWWVVGMWGEWTAQQREIMELGKRGGPRMGRTELRVKEGKQSSFHKFSQDLPYHLSRTMWMTK